MSDLPDPDPRSDDEVIAEAAAALIDWQASDAARVQTRDHEAAQLERVFQIGRALLLGREIVCRHHGVRSPQRGAAAAAWRAWRAENGLCGIGRRTRNAMIWAALHETDVRDYYGSIQGRGSTHSLPASAHPKSLMAGTKRMLRRRTEPQEAAQEASMAERVELNLTALRLQASGLDALEKERLIGGLLSLARDLMVATMPEKAPVSEDDLRVSMQAIAVQEQARYREAYGTRL